MKWLRDNDYRYLVVSRERTRHFDPEAAQRIETASRHGVHLHKVVSDDGHEVRLHCFSEERANKERAIVERFASRFEQALTKLCEGLSRPRTEKRASKIRERIGRLKAKSRGIAQHYHIDIDTDPAIGWEASDKSTRRFRRRTATALRIDNIGSGGKHVLGGVAGTIQCVLGRPSQITSRPDLHHLSALFGSHEQPPTMRFDPSMRSAIWRSPSTGSIVASTCPTSSPDWSTWR